MQKVISLNRIIPIIIICVTLVSFSKSEPLKRKILFISHTYYWHHYLDIDVRVKLLKFEEYDELWLGGDMTTESSITEKQVKKIDDIFNITSRYTHWALGNHDVRSGHLDRIEKIQKKPLFYSQHDFGVTKLILNTTIANEQVPSYLDSCHLLMPQLALINNVLDTIKESSHLIVMTGGIHWSEIIPTDRDKINYDYPTYSFGCDSILTFKNYLYPKLVEVQKRGVQVICTSGDLGQRLKQYEEHTDDGIVFLASGINNSFGSTKKANTPWVNNFDPDKILVFTHIPETRTLTYEFQKLDSVIGVKPYKSDSLGN